MILPNLDARRLMLGIRTGEVQLEDLSSDLVQLVRSWQPSFYAGRALDFQRTVLDGIDDPRYRETWVVAGRGAGKSRLGAEWIQTCAELGYEFLTIIGPSLSAIYRDNLLGSAGLIVNTNPNYPARLIKSAADPHVLYPVHPRTGKRPRVSLIPATRARTLRGNNSHKTLLDEVACYYAGDEVLANARYLTRGHPHAQILSTTTPRPNVRLIADNVLGRLEKDGSRTPPQETLIVTATTFSNEKNLSASFLRNLTRQYTEGSSRSRSELYGEIVLSADNTIFPMVKLREAMIPESDLPELERVIMAVDPNRVEGGDNCGAVIAGIDTTGTVYVLGDITQQGSPFDWLPVLNQKADHFGVSYVVFERNRLTQDTTDLLMRSGRLWLPRTAVGKKGTRALIIAQLLNNNKIKFVIPDDGIDACDLLLLELSEFTGSQWGVDDRVDACALACAEITTQSAINERIKS